jgi:hypothetical protein
MSSRQPTDVRASLEAFARHGGLDVVRLRAGELIATQGGKFVACMVPEMVPAHA